MLLKYEYCSLTVLAKNSEFRMGEIRLIKDGSSSIAPVRMPVCFL
jgi:hypothetical protein